MAERAVSTYTYEEYLALEANPGQKHEYHDGMITAMAGGSPRHGQLAMNIGRVIGNALEAKASSCIVYNSDVKVRIDASNRTFYPDLSVVCGELIASSKDAHAIANPTLIIEVLSESTADFDRGVKFAHYRRLPSLRQYVLISQDRVLLDSYFRTEADTWEIRTYESLNDLIELKSLAISFELSAVYYQISGL
ncbi:MAG: Uma2 family endonuclease [Bacteroidota bacterium]